MATLVLCKFIFCMNKKIIQFFVGALVFIGFSVCSPHAFADTVTFTPTAGVDASQAPSVPFSDSDLTKLATSDDTRIQSNGSWSTTNAYDESSYLEFQFAPSIPANATITNVTITHEFRRTGALTASKLEIYNGSNFTDKPLTVGTINVDHTDVVNITSVVPTIDKLSGLKVRFLAYRDVGGTTQTSHDWISLGVAYTLPVPPNTAPVVTAQSITTAVDTPILITLSGTDAENDPLTFSQYGQPQKGVLGSFTGNTVMYNPNGGLIGTDTFTVRAYDGKVYSTPATITVTLTHGAPAKLKAVTTPLAQVTTKTASVAVQVTDFFGNPIQEDNGTVVTLNPFLNSTATASSLSSTVSAGQATFTIHAISPTSQGLADYYVNAPGFAQGLAQLVFYAPPQQPTDGSIKVHIPVVSGSVKTANPATSFTDQNVVNLGTIDDSTTVFSYVATNAGYTESQYNEFTFAQGFIPTNATIKNVTLSSRSQSYSSPSKFEIGNGTSFVDKTLAPSPLSSAFINQAFDLTPIISTVTQANNLVVRYLVSPQASMTNITATFDLLGVDVTYTVPTPPVATAQTLTTKVDAPLVVTLSGTDTLHAPLSYTITTPPTKGTLSALAGASVTYTPLGQTGDDTFSFTAHSDSGDSIPATVKITLTEGHIQKLTATASTTNTTVGLPVQFSVSATDSFGNKVPLDASTNVTPAFSHGTLGSSGMVFSDGVGSISGTATIAGNYEFDVSVGSISAAPITIVFAPVTVTQTTLNTTTTTITDTNTNTNTNTNTDTNTHTTGTTKTNSSGGSTGRGGSGGGFLLATTKQSTIDTPPVNIQTVTQNTEQPKKEESKTEVPTTKEPKNVHEKKSVLLIQPQTEIQTRIEPNEEGAPIEDQLGANVLWTALSKKEIGYLCGFAIVLTVLVWTLLSRMKRNEVD